MTSLDVAARDFTCTYEGKSVVYTVISEELKTCSTRAGSSLYSPGNNISGDLILPGKPYDSSSESEFTLIRIEDYSFSQNQTMTSIYIPSSVTAIRQNAFRDCSTLAKVEFASIEALCKMNFYDAYSNPTINRPCSLYIDGEEVKDVVIPNSVTSIGNFAFFNCYSLQSIQFPETLISIGDRSFYNCSNLESVSIPESVREIQNGAFRLTGLNKVEFASIEALCKIKFDNGLLALSNPLTVAHHLYIDGQEVTEVVIPSSITELECTFDGASYITSIVLPSNLKKIGNRTFTSCSSLKSINIPSSIQEIGDLAFSGCSALKSVSIPESVNEIASGAFSNCTAFESVLIPESVTKIASAAFAGCTALKSVWIPKSVTEIEGETKVETSGTTLTLESAFYGCTALENIYYDFSEPIACSSDIFPESVYSDAILHVSDGGIEKARAIVPWSQFNKIVDGEFPVAGIELDKTKAKLSVGETLKLTAILYPVGVEASIVWSSSDESVATVDANGMVTSGYNFGTATITATVEGMTLSADCEIRVAESFDGVVEVGGSFTDGDYKFRMLDDGECEVLCPSSSFTGSEFNIPSTAVFGGRTLQVVAIASNAFRQKGTSVTFPEGLRTIGNYAFEGSSITSIVFPETLVSIGEHAFDFCPKLSGEIRIPDAVVEIGAAAFANCGSYGRSLILGKGLRSIGESAFATNYRYNGELVLPDGIEEIGSYAFYGTEFESDLVLPASLKTIGEGSFEQAIRKTKSGNLDWLPQLVINASLTSIPRRAFANNAFKGEILIPEGVDEIGESAFEEGLAWCLTGSGGILNDTYIYVVLPSTLKKIGSKAFVSASGGKSPAQIISKSVTPPACESQWIGSKVNGSTDYLTTILEQAGLLLVPQEAVDAYEADSNWNFFRWINPMADSGATGITLNQNEAEITTGESFKLEATIEPADVMAGIVWSSSDESVATVDSEGVVSGVAPGTAIITVMVNGNPELTAQCEVTVEEMAVTSEYSVGVNVLAVELYKGRSLQLSALVKPEPADGEKAVWSSSRVGSVAVDETGMITAIERDEANSTVDISAAYRDGLGICKVIVVEPKEGTSDPDLNIKSITLNEGFTIKLKELLENADEYEWSSSDENVLRVDAEGNLVGVSRGYAELTVTGSNGTTTIDVVVAPELIVAESIVVVPSESVMRSDNQIQFKVEFLPLGAQREEVVWEAHISEDCWLSLSQEITSDGLLTAHGIGVVTVRTYTADWRLSATSEVCAIPIDGGLVGDFIYRPVGENECEIVGYRRTEGTDGIRIPAQLEDGEKTYRVISIGQYAFASHWDISGPIEIPETVEKIGDNAFSQSSALDGMLILPSGLTHIGDGAFYECRGLSGVKLHENIVVGYNAFYDCEGLIGTLEIPSGIYLENYAFMGCTGIEKLTFGDNVTISDGVFSGCSGIKGELILPETLKLNSASSAFNGCSGLTGTLRLPESWTEIPDHMFIGCSGLEKLELHDGITSIGQGAFDGCSNLTGELVFPASLTQIRTAAFNGAVGLTSLDFRKCEGTVAIHGAAFKDCTGLTGELRLPDSWYFDPYAGVYSGGAFEGCFRLTGDIVIPRDAHYIPKSTFSGCRGLNGHLVIKSEYLGIGNEAFLGCQFSEITVYPAVPPRYMDGDEPENVFSRSVYESSTLHVPEISMDQYSQADIWKKFKKIEGTLYPVTNIELEQSDITLQVGESVKLNVAITPENATDKTLEYNVYGWYDPSEAPIEVDAEGNVKALRPGSTTISITPMYAAMPGAGGTQVDCSITVIEQQVLPTSITLDKTSLYVHLAENPILVVTLEPENVTNSTITWTSSDENIANVDGMGQIWPRNLGSTLITATTVNGLTATCELTVGDHAVEYPTGIILSQSNIVMYLDETQGTMLSYSLEPGGVTESNVIWASADESIAYVDAYGWVIPRGVGSTVITATTVNGLEATCYVIVEAPREKLPESITFGFSSASMNVGEQLQLQVMVEPAEASAAIMTWTSSDPNVASVDENGVVTGHYPGYTQIVATTVNGLMATCDLMVKAMTLEPQEIHLNLSDAGLNISETLQLVATVGPEYATDQSVTWTSSDESVAVVDANGLVTPANVGQTVIYARTVNGLEAMCLVTVFSGDEMPAVESMKMSIVQAIMNVGSTLRLYVQTTPAEAIGCALTWTSSNPQIASVDGLGNVSALNIGETIITARADNGVEARCLLMVGKDVMLPEWIILDYNSLNLMTGESRQLIPTLGQATDEFSQVYWRSSNNKIATIDDSGHITANTPGIALMTATTVNGHEATCMVYVASTDVAVQGIELNYTTYELIEGETTILEAFVYPENATDKSVTWSSSDDMIATVDQNGQVTALKPGIVIITAATHNGLLAACELTVQVATGIAGVESDQQISVTVSDGVIIVTAPDAAEVEVYSLTGLRMVKTKEHRIEGLAGGVYIVNVRGRSFKVML